MKCTECGSDGALEQRFSWELPPGRYGYGDDDEEERLAVAPKRRLCEACVNRFVRAYNEANPVTDDDVIHCPRCEAPTRRGDMKFLAKPRGAAILCERCYAGGLLPDEGRGSS